MAKRRSPEAGGKSDEVLHDTNELPSISHLQFLVLDMLLKGGGSLSANALRENLTRFAADYKGPKFYQLMNRMIASGLVIGESRSVAVADAAVNRTYYKSAAKGKLAHRVTLHFYNARQEIWAVLASVLKLVDDTAAQLEAGSPGLAEVGSWSQEQKRVYVRAKKLLELETK